MKKSSWNNASWLCLSIHSFQSSAAKTVQTWRIVEREKLQLLSCRKLSQIVLFSFVIIPRNEIKTKREKIWPYHGMSGSASITHMSAMPISDFELTKPCRVRSTKVWACGNRNKNVNLSAYLSQAQTTIINNFESQHLQA